VDAVHAETACYRHPKRETYVRCSRCDRYICSDCMRDAPVGQRCPECVKGENKTMRPARTVFGGRTVTTAWVTYTLIGLNVLAYLAELIHPAIVDRFDNIGSVLLGPDGGYYIDDGVTTPGYVLAGVLHGEWWRLLTSTFLHMEPGASGFGLAHIVLNMFWIYTFGRFLEEKLGRIRFLALYVLSGIGGSVLAVLLDPGQSAVGASGAGFGLAAAYFVVTRKLHEHPINRNQIMVYLLVWLVVSAGFASWQGHLGGLLVGGAVGFGFAYAPRRHREVVQGAVVAATASVLILAVVAAAVTT
jgi:membrane associated rhomboid family serine protease